MRHLGDITKISGNDAPTVNVVIGGSPCQDLSIAGKRMGLAGERSGLFMEQLRIIKEMRKKDAESGKTGADIRPRFMVWENVPGAFSSNKGSDFGAVLQETVRVVCKEAPAIPLPKNGWPNAGCLTSMDTEGGGGCWSIAWRVFDAQFWGVPQRRRRIALVADFGGLSAPEVLFECESVPGNFESCGTERQRSTRSPENGTSFTVRIRGGCDGGGKGALVQEEKSGTLGCSNDQTVFCIQGNTIDRANTAGCNGKGWKQDVSYTLNTIDRPAIADCIGISNCGVPNRDVSETLRASSHGALPMVCAGFSANLGAKAHGIGYANEQSPTLSSQRHDAAVVCLNDQGGSVMSISDDVSGTLRAQEHGHQPIIAFSANQRDELRDLSGISGALQAQPGMKQQTFIAEAQSVPAPAPCSILDMAHACDVVRDCGGTSPSLQARMGTGGNQVPLVADIGFFSCTEDVSPTLLARTYKDPHVVKDIQKTVRRLTPLECERLQGFPDGWTDIGEWMDSKGKVHKESSDSTRYKALGNSIALPSWYFVLFRLSCVCGEKTMASLFDGIGGFPLIWEHLNGKGSCIWASEIEEFPIAVTKKHFPDKKEDDKTW